LNNNDPGCNPGRPPGLYSAKNREKKVKIGEVGEGKWGDFDEMFKMFNRVKRFNRFLGVS